MNKLKIAAAVVLTLASAASFAQSKNSEGFYGLANFGFTNVKGNGSGSWKDNNNNDVPFTSTSSSAGNSWNLGLGYDFDESYAVEASVGSMWKQEQQWSSKHQYGSNRDDSKTNVLALTLTALYKHPISENTKLFFGPTVTHLRLKGSESRADYNSQGQLYYSKDDTSSFSKTLPGLTMGSTFALDKKTDFRISYTMLKKWTDSSVKSNGEKSSEDNKISNLSFGLTIKF